MAESSAIDPQPINAIIDAAYQANAVHLALRIGLFDALAEPASANDIASALELEPIAIEGLLDYLTGIGLILWRDGNYALTPSSAAFLVAASVSYAGGYLLDESGTDMWEGVHAALTSKQPSGFWSSYEQDAWLESYSQTRPESSRELWRTAGVLPLRRSGMQVLDVACGCAIKSLVLAQEDPELRITGIDREPVLAVARDLACRLGVERQIETITADVLTAQFPLHAYDIVLLGQITYFFTPEQNADVFAKLATCLAPGGVLVIDAIMHGAAPSPWAGLVALLTRSLTGGNAYRFEEYRNWLEAAGLTSVRQLSEHAVAAHSPERNHGDIEINPYRYSDQRG